MVPKTALRSTHFFMSGSGSFQLCSETSGCVDACESRSLSRRCSTRSRHELSHIAHIQDIFDVERPRACPSQHQGMFWCLNSCVSRRVVLKWKLARARSAIDISWVAPCSPPSSLGRAQDKPVEQHGRSPTGTLQSHVQFSFSSIGAGRKR